MNELADILSAVSDSHRPQWDGAVLATLVCVDGSSYRRPGARMLIRPDGATLGTLSGGCLEQEIREHCFEWTREGAVFKSFDLRGEREAVFGWGSGCNGMIGVLLEKTDSRRPLLESMQELLSRRKAFALATLFATHGQLQLPVGTLLFDGETINTDLPPPLRDAVLEDARASLACGHSRNFTYEILPGMAQVLIEVIKPPVSLLLFGSSTDAMPVAQAALQLGWSVTVLDKRDPDDVAPRFPPNVRTVEIENGTTPQDLIDDQSVAVVMTHNFVDDAAIVANLLPTPVRYVGLLGGRARSRKLVGLIQHDQPQLKLGKLHAPIGLDLGALDPQEIALSIVAEILAFIRGRNGASLRERRGSMHFDSHTIARHVEATHDFSVTLSRAGIES